MIKIFNLTLIGLFGLLVSCAQNSKGKGKHKRGLRPSPDMIMKHKDTNQDGVLLAQGRMTKFMGR